MAENLIVRNKRDLTVLLADNGAAHIYTISAEPGDVNYSVPGESTDLYLDRGIIGSTPSIRGVDEAPMTVGGSAYLRDLGAATYATLLDIAHRYVAGYVLTNWVSTMGSGTGMPFTVTITLTLDGAKFGETDKSVSFPFCVYRANVKEGSPDSIDWSATSYAAKPVLA